MARKASAIDIRTIGSENDLQLIPPEARDFLASLARLAPPAPTGEESKGFATATAAIRDSQWMAPLPPRDLSDLRTVLAAPLAAELTYAPRLWLADAADLTPPRWATLIAGHRAVANRAPKRVSPLMLRVRPLDQRETNVKAQAKHMPAGLFDAGLFLFHESRRAEPKLYLALTGVFSRKAARRWRDILIAAESLLGLPMGSVRVAVEIDHPSAVWELDEILHELRDHAAAVFTGGYRYAREAARAALSRPRGRVSEPLFYDKAISGHVVRVAHRRGIPAISAALGDDAAPEAERAVRSGFDGLILSSAQQVSAVAKIFDHGMPTPNQIYVDGEDGPALPDDLVRGPEAARSEEAFAAAVSVALAGFASALGGDSVRGGLARADFACLDLWHWTRLSAKLGSGAKAGEELYENCVFEAMRDVPMERGTEAEALLRQLVFGKVLPQPFLEAAARKLA